MNSPADLTEAEQAYYDQLTHHHLAPLWRLHADIQPPEPRPATLAWQWKGTTLRKLAAEAGELVPIDRGGDRRVLSVANPGLAGAPWATPTLWGAIQHLGPREGAPAHRHSPAAIRFVLEGRGVFTTVEGDAISMEPGDLVLTPPGLWHDHLNPTDDPMTWFDGLDLPLVGYLDATFVEKPPTADHQIERGTNLSESMWPTGAVVDTTLATDSSHSPRLRYPWAETDAALQAALERSESGVASVSYRNPATGGSALPTLECRMHRIAQGGRSLPTQKTGHSLFVIYRGRGESVIGGTRFRWEAGDILVAPSWAAVEHGAETDVDVLEISDEPVLRALHLLRECSHDTPQAVETDFHALEAVTT